MSDFNVNYENFDCAMENAGARWNEWIEDFELYLTACNITAQAKARRRAALLHCGGKEMRRIYDTIKGVNDDYEDIKEKLTKYFEPQRNKRFERLKFRQAKQEQDESIDAFVSRLKYLAKYCEYDDVNDQIIDQLAIFSSSNSLKKKILERKEITLDKVLEFARTIETVEFQMKDIANELGGTDVRSDSDSIKAEVNAVKSHRSGSKCSNCGLSHQANDCPAKNKKCNSCGRNGHYSRCCRSANSNKTRKVNHVECEGETSSDESDGGW